MTGKVVRLGAWCELVSENAAAHQRSFRVGEFAVLADGRRIELHHERGWSEWLRVAGGELPADFDIWHETSREDLERAVLDVVLPDGEEPTEDHPWEWLTELLRARGIETAPDELRVLPYDIELSAGLESRFTRSE